MNKLSILLLCSLLPCLAFAQKNKKVNYLFSNPPEINIDANITDWDNTLTYVGDELWAFSVTERNNNLYVTIVIKDLQLQREAFRGGLFIDVSYDGKKKEGARLQFPYWDRERRRALADLGQHEETANLEKELLNNVNGYFLTGFGRVRDGVLALQNDYGIDGIVKIDTNKCLVYEAKIPLQLVGLKSEQIAVNLGINTQYALLKKAASNANKNRNMYPMMGRPVMQSTLKNPYSGETEVWVYNKIIK
ncbi:MAG: hypothetical protein ACI35V_08280 [Sphingobacterium composti]